jgi:hypothetical protein
MAHSRPAFILYRDAEDGGVDEITLPTKKAVCPDCKGTGSHVNRAIDGNGITSSEMAELGDDFREDYLAGVYDVTCETCEGANVVDELDEERCKPDDLEAFRKQEEEHYRDYNSESTLRRMESGERW